MKRNCFVHQARKIQNVPFHIIFDIVEIQNPPLPAINIKLTCLKFDKLKVDITFITFPAPEFHMCADKYIEPPKSIQI